MFILIGIGILGIVLTVINVVVYEVNKKMIEKFNKDFDISFRDKIN